jgi:hypothetical protein
MNNENETISPNTTPSPAPAPVNHPEPPSFPPDRIEIHSDPGPSKPFPQSPRPDKES